MALFCMLISKHTLSNQIILNYEQKEIYNREYLCLTSDCEVEYNLRMEGLTNDPAINISYFSITDIVINVNLLAKWPSK